MNWTIPILKWTIPILKWTIPILNWTTPILNWKRYRTLSIPRLKSPSALRCPNSWRENNSMQSFLMSISAIRNADCTVDWCCRIHRLLLYRGVRLPSTSVVDMTLNHLMVRFQLYRNFEECAVPLYCHGSDVNKGLLCILLITLYLITSY